MLPTSGLGAAESPHSWRTRRSCFLQRTAQRTTKFISPERRRVALIEEIRSIERVVAQKFECRPMPLVRSRLRQNHYLPAWPLAEFRSVRVALHVEFPHPVHSEKHPAGSSGLHIVFGRARKFHAIEQKKILLRALPRNREIIRGGGIRNPRAARFQRCKIYDARVERQQ